jgi:hypothetical protein
MMLDQMLESFCKASQSSLKMQQEVWKRLTRRWLRLTLNVLEKEREALDWSFKTGMQPIEQALRASEAGGGQDHRRLAQELWHKLFETLRSEYDNQLQDVKRWAETSFRMVPGQGQRS